MRRKKKERRGWRKKKREAAPPSSIPGFVTGCERASVVGKFPFALSTFFSFLQKYNLHCLSSRKFSSESFDQNMSSPFLSYVTESSIFPTYFLCSKQGQTPYIVIIYLFGLKNSEFI
jgi:hypothetical protein